MRLTGEAQGGARATRVTVRVKRWADRKLRAIKTSDGGNRLSSLRQKQDTGFLTACRKLQWGCAALKIPCWMASAGMGQVWGRGNNYSHAAGVSESDGSKTSKCWRLCRLLTKSSRYSCHPIHPMCNGTLEGNISYLQLNNYSPCCIFLNKKCLFPLSLINIMNKQDS